ncbi:MAG: ATP-binding protein [Proteobacteria bacterium]|nr:ATP-binding protein [Pseudomonadota bacterium]
MTNLLTNTIIRQKPEIKRILESAFVPREMTQNLVNALDDDAIKVIIGPRRSGKSSVAVQALSNKKFAYFNFEDESINFDFTSEQLLASLEQVYPNFEYLLFDELQLFPKWEHLVNRLHRLGYKIVITGSNSKLLSSELASSLTGRYLEFKLLTFSYNEYLTTKQSERGAHSFDDYLHSGGFPSVATGRSQGHDFLPTLWDAIILKDLVQRYKIRNSVELKNLLHIILTNMSARVSARSLSRNLNEHLSHATVSKYLSWAEGAYLCTLLHQFSFKARERVNSDKKIYLYDNGFYSTHKKSGSRDVGRLLENYVFIEICRHGYTPNLDFFSYQTRSKFEVDFYIHSSSQNKKLIQVCYNMTDQETQKREIRALVAAASELGVKELYIVTCDDAEQVYTQDGYEIKAVPAWDFEFK